MSSGDAAPSDAVEATIARLTAHKNVQGVLILARDTGIIIRSAGTLFAVPPAPATAPVSEDADGVINGAAVTVSFSETARAYAKAARALVESVGSEVARLEDGDDLKFMRLRTRKHELIVTPDSLYILVVVQDPTT
ncbi:dynein light chain roadblock-type, partial [Phenoliferia sp. Uapishka_3]